MVSFVVTRDGTKAKFDITRIEVAVEKALHACTGKDERISCLLKEGKSIQTLSKELARSVQRSIRECSKLDRLITVELIQNLVELQLMEQTFYVTAKEYILYRAQHARQRRHIQTSKGVPSTHKMVVIKRDGQTQPMSKDKIFKRIRRECEREPVLMCESTVVAEKVLLGLHDNVSTQDLDTLIISVTKDMVIQHPDYGVLASRVAILGHHKDTDFTRAISEAFVDTQIAFAADRMFRNVDENGDSAPLLQRELCDYILEHQVEIDEVIDYALDFNISLFGFQTLERAYLMKAKTPSSECRKIVERPQDMFMRVALGIHCVRPNVWLPKDLLTEPSDYEGSEFIDDVAIALEMRIKFDEFVPDFEAAMDTYRYLSQGYFIHATPTLIYAGMTRPCLSSCFLVAIDSDSIDGIYKTLTDCAKISKNAGGIGCHIHKIRANASYIRGTAGKSNGIVPMLRNFNMTADYVDQCFAPGTIVHTSEGPRNIETIKKGDKLLSAGGLMQPVDLVLEHDYDGPMLRVTIKYAIESVLVTPEHQILALKRQTKGTNFSTLRIRLDKGYAKAEMVDAKELEVDDFVCFPIPKGDDILDIPDIDCDDLRFYGILIGDGWVGEGGNNSGISMGTSDKVAPIREFVENYLRRKGIHVTVTIRHESHNIRYQWSTTHAMFKFRREQLYDENKEKIIWRPFFRLPTDKLLSILRGIFEANGSIKKECVLEMSSKKVIDGVRHILLRCGIMSSGYVRDRRGNVSSYKGIVTRKITYALRIPRVPQIMALFPSAPKGKYVNYLVHDGMMYCRITNMTREHFAGKVYDFKVANEHTYVTDMGSCHNGGGKRKGAFAIYLELWHADIEDFLELKLPHGQEKKRCRDLFFGVWRCDYFMECVLQDWDWYLMCPDACPGLAEVYGADFVALYEKYVEQGKYRKVVKARDIYKMILRSRTECGVPYIGEKDSINRKSNQSNLGVIQSSNLCCEIVLYSDRCETAVCNLSSIALPKFIQEDEEGTKYIDHDHLHRVSQIVTRNLNKVIDRNHYPTPESARSNYRHRPIGIGVQGLWDVFMQLRVPFGSEEAIQIDREIFETIYHGALTASWELAKEEGAYSSFRFGKGSPLSHGKFQFDLWSDKPQHSGQWNWDVLRENIMKDGARNSELIAPMPTASTSQILDNTECLVGETLVTLRSGLAIPIKNMKTRNGVIGVCNAKMKADLSVGLIDQGIKDTITLVFSDGREIQCTPNHRFQLSNGKWKEASKLDLNRDKICVGLEPVLDIQDFNTWVWGGKTWKRAEALALARIIGYVHADGNVYKYKTKSTPQATAYLGCQYDVETFVQDIELVGGSCTVRTNKQSRIHEVRIHAYISRLIEKALGSGRRISRDYYLPDFVTDPQAPLSIVREYIAGHFGGDGHRPNLAWSALKGVKLSHCVYNRYLPELKDFFDKLKELLYKIGIKGTINIRDQKTRSKSYNDDVTEVLMELAPNTFFATKIGFRYCIDKSVKLSIANSYWRTVEKAMEQRDKVIEKAKYLREVEHLSAKKAIEKAQAIIFENMVAINKYAMGNPAALRYKRTRRNGRCGISPKEYIETFEAWNEKYCCDRGSIFASTFYLHLIDRKETGKERVWDITVEDTHAFFANGVAVHNCIEPIKSNLYKRKTSSGEFLVLNKYLYQDLDRLGLDIHAIREQIEAGDGSIQHIDEIPQELKDLYVTVWDMDQKLIIDHCVARSPYVTQACSMNLYLQTVDPNVLMDLDLYAWSKGLKTQYYLHSKSATKAKQHHSATPFSKKEKEIEVEGNSVCTFEEGCMMCGS